MEAMDFWRSQHVLVTGGAGFLGSHLCARLRETSVAEIRIPRSREYDLRDREACREVVRGIDILIHLAARVGGIGYNQARPGELFYDNAIMGIQLMEEARRAGVKKFVGIATICAYPKYTPVPFREEDLWSGYPEETNAPYGLAKKMLLVQAQAYRAQYGFNAITLFPVNLYGPGDNFHPESSHVIPALVRRFTEARERGVEAVAVWGDGTPTREFLYVDDAAEAILLATERYDDPGPLNIGSGMEISIRELAEHIAELTRFRGRIEWDTSKPNGQPRRQLDVSKAERLIGFRARTDFARGLLQTVRWFEEKHAQGLV
jgi:GDP-L-fucose synthase